MRNKEIQERMNSLNDESLIKIITEEFNDYEEEALEIAKEELESRNINVDDYIIKKRFKYVIEHTDTDISDLLLFKDIIINMDYNLIENALFSFYPDEQEFKEEYGTFYNELLKLPVDEDKSVLIKIEKQLEDVNDSEITLYNTFGVDTKTGEILDLELFTWNQWLSFYINQNDLKEMGKENFIANCLYKMTINGFCNEDIERNLEKSEEINNLLFNISSPNNIDITDNNIYKAALLYKSRNSQKPPYA